MDNLTPEEYKEMWEQHEPTREAMRKRMNYYKGHHAIVGSDEYYSDGSKKSERVTNYIGYAVDMYVGSITGQAYNVTAVEGDEEVDNDGPLYYREIGTANNFDTTDIENTRNAFVYGWGLETFSYSQDSGLVITPQDPINWLRIYNSDAELIGLINLSTVPGGGFVGDERLTSDLTVMVIYTKNVIRTFHQTADLNNGEWFTPEGLEDTIHHFGVVPAVVYKINEDFTSHITDDVIGQQDEYNEIDSASGDDVKGESDGLLALKGFDAEDVQNNAETIKRWRLLGLPADGDAYYIRKGTDTARSSSRLDRTRQHIFMGLSVPNVEDITGATGATSGIALQLKFKPMIDKSGYIIANLRSGIRDRIELINAVQRKLGSNDLIESVQVNIMFSLPRNTVEEWQNIKSLDGVVSSRKQLELLTDVTDPDEEERRLRKELESTTFDLSQEGASAERAEVVEQKARGVEPTIGNVIEQLSDAVLIETQKRI